MNLSVLSIVIVVVHRVFESAGEYDVHAICNCRVFGASALDMRYPGQTYVDVRDNEVVPLYTLVWGSLRLAPIIIIITR